MKLRDYLEEQFELGGRRLARSIELWRAGIDSEVGFWTRWVETKGLEWPTDYQNRMTQQQMEVSLLELLPQCGVSHVLDVGAGPVTRIGTVCSDRTVKVVAVDPLAQYYDDILSSAGITPPVRTQFAFCEDLSARFDFGSLDLVCSINALDHAIEPFLGIVEMLLVSKLEAKIYLHHYRNEAEKENYSGFHQWNFDIAGEEFIIWEKAGRSINVTQLLNEMATTSCRLSEDRVIVTITKRSELPIEPILYQRRMRAGLLEAILVDHSKELSGAREDRKSLLSRIIRRLHLNLGEMRR